MFPVDYNLIHKIIACIIVGIVAKVLDDYIDGDHNNSKTNTIIFALEQQRRMYPYTLILFAFAAGFHVEYAVTLISACYIVGMFHNFDMKLPTGVKSFHEIFIVFLINIFLFSFKSITTSLLVIILFQLLDDIQDMKWDKKYGYKNYANQFGKIEVIIASLIILIVLIMLDMEKLMIVLVSILIINAYFSKRTFSKPE